MNGGGPGERAAVFAPAPVPLPRSTPLFHRFCVYCPIPNSETDKPMAHDIHITVVCALSKWIENHLGRVIHLEELASYSGYSLWHMQKLFKESTGISLGKYIRERRLAGAVYQLSASDTPIFDIAMDFGFGSQSHFTYMFRKRFNITPHEFRQNPDITLDIAPPLHLIHQKTA